MKKRILPLLLTLALCVSLVTPALAANSVTISTDINGDNTPDVCYIIPDVLDATVYQSVWRDTDNWDYDWVFGNDPENVKVYTVKTGVKIDVGGLISAHGVDLELADGKLVIRDAEPDWDIVWKFDGEIVPIYPDEPDMTMFSKGSSIQFIKEGFYAFTVQPDSPMGLKSNASCVLYISDDGTSPVAPVAPTQPEQPTVPTVSPVVNPATLDGKAISLNAYLFTEGNAGTNYVMLRDVAQLLNGSKAQFEVTWSKDKGIIITTGQAYTPVGHELDGKGTDAKAYTANASTITIDGKAVELTAYTIEGNNYFKLRDLGAALNFNVSWDKDKGVTIDSNASYSAES